MSAQNNNSKNEKSLYKSLLENSDPYDTSEGSMMILYVFIGLAVLGMVLSSFAPTMKEMTTILVALIFLSLGIWYMLYSIKLYKIYTQKDNSVMARLYDRLLTAIGN